MLNRYIYKKKLLFFIFFNFVFVKLTQSTSQNKTKQKQIASTQRQLDEMTAAAAAAASSVAASSLSATTSNNGSSSTTNATSSTLDKSSVSDVGEASDEMTVGDGSVVPLHHIEQVKSLENQLESVKQRLAEVNGAFR